MEDEVSKVFTAEHDGKRFAVLVDRKDRLLASAFSSHKSDPVGKRIAKLANKPVILDRDHPFIRDMARICKGEKPSQKSEVDSQLVSSFQKQVYDILRQIPKGKVTSYGLISKTMHSSPRAVGSAVGSNPWPLFVPCHRVIPASLTIGNYSMNGKPTEEGSRVKRELLENEGVEFQGDRIAISCLWTPPRA